MDLISPPRISRSGFIAVLQAAGSPAAPVAGDCYDAIASTGVDPAVGLAFFRHESEFGLRGWAARTHNWGNLRPGKGWLIREGLADGMTERGEFLVFRQRPGERAGWEWVRSALAWARLIREVYCDTWNLRTVEAAVPVYAPAADRNRPAAYIRAVIDAVERWQKEFPPDVPLDEQAARLRRDLEAVKDSLHALAHRLEMIEAALGEIENALNAARAAGEVGVSP